MKQHKLIFGDVDTSSFGVWLTGSGTFSAPTRDVEYISVPGRNGDLLIDNGKWNNIDVTYPANIPPLVNMDSNLADLRAALCRQTGYRRLEDTYHPDEFRRAAFTSGLSPVPSPDNRGADFDLVFSCKPQRFLKSGDEPIKLLPPMMSGSTIEYSQYIKIGADYLEYALAFKTTDTITVDVYVYDEDLTLINTISNTYTDGVGGSGIQFDMDTDVYYRFHITGISDPDATKLTIQKGSTEYEISAGITEIVDLAGAVMCRKVVIENPTGYETTPTIEFFREMIPSFSITNQVGGFADEYYVFSISDTNKPHFIMDCDMQYVYADDGTNLTNKLTITTAQSAIGKALVFPTLGTDKIIIEATMTTSTNDGCGLVNIYPRWWKL